MKTKRLFAILLSVLMIVALVPASIFGLSETDYVVDENVCTITGTVDSFRELDAIARRSDVETIVFSTGSKLMSNDLTQLMHLGDDNDGNNSSPVTSPIPSIVINSSLINYMKAFNRLPAYSETGVTIGDVEYHFAESHDTKTPDGISFPQDFKWQTNVKYVYDGVDHSVVIKHQVKDETGKNMLPYRDAGGAASTDYYNVDESNDAIVFNKVNSPQAETGQSFEGRIQYTDVIWGLTQLSETERGSKWGVSLSYRYSVVPEFFSAVSLDLDVEYTVSIEIIKENPDGEPLSGASFKIYTDADCTKEAVKYDGTAVGTVTTGSDGKVVVSGLPPVQGGKYYAKETKAPEGYALNKTVVEFEDAGQYDTATLSIDGNSGEGTSITVNKATSTFVPDWDGNARRTGTTPLTTSTTDTETKTAANYSKDVFFKAGGNAVAYSDPTVATAVDNGAINNPTYAVKVGTQVKKTCNSGYENNIGAV